MAIDSRHTLRICVYLFCKLKGGEQIYCKDYNSAYFKTKMTMMMTITMTMKMTMRRR